MSGDYKADNDEALSFLGVLFHSFHTMSNNLLAEKLRRQQPAIYIRPDIRNVRVLEFYKARQVFEQALPAQQQLTRALKRVLRHYSGPGCSLPSASIYNYK